MLDSPLVKLVSESASRSRWVLTFQLIICIVLVASWWPFSNNGWLLSRIERLEDGTRWFPFEEKTLALFTASG